MNEKPNKCLHCHLHEALEAWLDEYASTGKPANLAMVAAKITSVLADIIEAGTQPGDERATACNMTTIGFVSMMHERINRPVGETGAPPGAAKH